MASSSSWIQLLSGKSFLIIISILLANFEFNESLNYETINLTIKGQGIVMGNYDTTAWSEQFFMQFRGIPYAESPKGSLRYKAPIARQPWNNILDATKWGRRCPVITTIIKLNQTEILEDLEDCLNLCVYTKNLTTKTPVMMYVHGGGFYNGTSLDHPPKYLMEEDIVLVVPQYRIGALGFISSETDEIPGNAALADMLFTLKWIQNHISSFGGDPERVTIFGQSAGAAIVGALILSPKTPNSYFQRAIMQSGSILGHWAVTEKPYKQAQRICEKLNCENCKSVQETNVCLMNVDVLNLLNATQDEWISPVVGDKLEMLPKLPDQLFEEYNKKISIMTGFTKHDGSYLLGEQYDNINKIYGNSLMSVREFISIPLNSIGDRTKLINNLSTRLFFKRELLDGNNHRKALPSYFDLFSVIYFKSPALALTSQFLHKNQTQVFLYTFDYEGQHTRFGYEMGNEHFPFNGGVHHSNDNIYLFSTHELNSKDAKISQKIVKLWTTFAIEGKPYNNDDNVTIQSMASESGPYFHINENITIGYDVFDELTATIDDPENYKLVRNKISFL